MPWSQPRRIYAAEFKCGVIKIGVTSSQLSKRAKGLFVNGQPPIRVHAGPVHECGFYGERLLIERMRRIAFTHRGREWFTGVRFGVAKQLVEQVTRMALAMQAERAEAA